MILESAQMFSFAAHALHRHKPWMYAVNKAHVKHPSTKWLYQTEQYRHNWLWLLEMCIELDKIRNSVKGKHGSLYMMEEIYSHMFGNSPRQFKLDLNYCEFTMYDHLAMPDFCKTPLGPVLSYRNFYITKLARMNLDYQYRDEPDFVTFAKTYLRLLTS
jgi:hypothetical protein